MEYTAKVDLKDFDPMDRCDVQGLKAKFSTERKMFADHVVKRKKIEQSAEQVLNCNDFKAATTDIFFNFHYEERPSIDLGGTVNGGALGEDESNHDVLALVHN